MFELITRVHVALLLATAHLDDSGVGADERPTSPPRRRLSDDRGQATTEYALVLLAAALVAVLVITWAISSIEHVNINQ